MRVNINTTKSRDLCLSCGREHKPPFCEEPRPAAPGETCGCSIAGIVPWRIFHDPPDIHERYQMEREGAAMMSEEIATLETRLAAIEKAAGAVNEELAAYWEGCTRCASWLGNDVPGFEGCDLCRGLRTAYRALRAALEEKP